MRIANALTVDVEDYFQVQVMAGTVPRTAWEDMPQRVEANTDRLLAAFDGAGARATFFVLGWIAQRHPALVRRIVAGGHELASHGYGHERVDRLDEAAFRADIHRARCVLEDTAGVAVRGYRAPTFSIGPRTPWAYAALREDGYCYSSSVYPVKHDLYGTPDAPRFPHRVDDGFWEIPMTTLCVLGRNWPCSGGGWFRLLPYPLFRLGLGAFQRTHGTPAVFYTHPWEYDPAQPRIAVRSALGRFRHYVNLSRSAGRLERLLRDFAWDRMDRAFAEVMAGTIPRGPGNVLPELPER